MAQPAATRATSRAGRRSARRSAVRAVLRSALPLVVLLALAPSAVSAHAQVVALHPEGGSIAPVSPAAFAITFNEPVGLATGGLTVIDGEGQVVDQGDEVADGPTVRQALPPLPDGWYVVTWGVVSEDGHIVRASSVFGVGDADAAARPDADGGDGAWLTGASRFATDLGMLVAVGAWAAWWLLRARIPRVRWLALGAVALALSGTLAWAWLEYQDGGSTWLETPAAALALARAAALSAALLTGIAWPLLSAVLAAASLATLAGGGHSAGDPFAMLLLAAHLAAAVVWLGAAPAVLLTLRSPLLSDGEATDVVRRFSRLAGLALIAIAMAGAALTWNLSDGLTGGLTSPWVLTLGGKLALVGGAVLLGFAGRGHLRTGPDRRRLMHMFLVDAAILSGVALLSSLLTLTSPHVGHAGHEVGGDSRCVATLGDRSVSIIAMPGHVGTNDVLVGGVPTNVHDTTLKWVHELTEGGAIAMEAVPHESAWTASGPLPLAGPWDVTIEVRVDTFTQESGSCVLTIRP